MTADRRTTVGPVEVAGTHTPAPTAGATLPPPTSITIAFGLVMFLVTFSRWGSHLGIPGAPLFVSDMVLALVAGQTVRALRRSGTGLRDLKRAAREVHISLLLTATFLVWVGLRALLGAAALGSGPLSALRDAAPYGYIAMALAAFLLPVRNDGRVRRVVYAGLGIHLVWALGAPLLPGWPDQWPQLGDAAVFATRPDFDSAVFGIAAALALHDMLAPGRVLKSSSSALLALTVLGNGYALAASPTRAGLLAGVAAVGSVIAVRLLRAHTLPAPRTTSPRRRGRNIALGLVALVVFVGATSLSPAGQRIVDSLGGNPSSALGTLQAREYTWSGVTRYILSDAGRTAVGVGFGPDFITDSGTSFALEGTEFKDVRSPHNYILGTFARLGVAGALLVATVLLTAGALAVTSLRAPGHTVTVFAALLVIALPVTALLGVVLESPFGAIPYFWAVGHLARVRWGRGRAPSAGDVPPVPVARAHDAVAQADLGLPAERVDP